MAYGTPAPKVIETISRAMTFNLKKTNKEDILQGYRLGRPFWESTTEDYPYNAITGNFHPGEAHKMYKIQLKNYFELITKQCNATTNFKIQTY